MKILNNSKGLILKKFDRSVEIVLVIGLIVVIVVIVLVFLLNRSGFVLIPNNNEVDISQITSSSPDKFEVLEIKDEKNITIENTKISLPENWRVISVLKDYSNNTAFVCKDSSQKECLAHLVTNGTITYYVSTPAPLLTQVSIVTKDDVKNLSVSGKEYAFNYSKIEMVNRDEATGELTPVDNINIYKEVYGCFSEGVCVSSGYLNVINEEENKKQVNEFEIFVKSLNIQQ